MAIKAGQIIHVGNGSVLVDRVQTGGPGQLNIPTEKIYELGNYKSVGTIRDVPDLSFALESFDVSTEVETILAGAYTGRSVSDAVTTNSSATVTSATAAFTSADVGRGIIITAKGTGTVNGVTRDYYGTIAAVGSATSITVSPALGASGGGSGVTIKIVPNGIDLATAVPVDIASQWKPGESASSPFSIVNSVAMPFLYVESMSYRFGYRDNSTQSATLRGDSIFYNPGPTVVQTAAGSGVAGQSIILTNGAYQSSEPDGRWALSVEVDNKRLTLGVDYTETVGAPVAGVAPVTIVIPSSYGAIPATSTIRVMFTNNTALSYLQNVHPDTATKPAAIRGKDIDVYIGTAPGVGLDVNDYPTAGTSFKMKGVQAVTIDWRANIDKNEEFGNYYATGVDFDVPTVNGTIDFRPTDPADLMRIIQRITGAPVEKAIGAGSSVLLPLDVVLKSPETGMPVKRFNIPDARFTLPGYQGRVQQKVDVTTNFESETGLLKVYER
jgi:hypothetical protein